RAVRVRERDDITGTRVDLPVASEGVGPLRLRTAMHVENNRILLARIKAMRLDQKHLNLRAARALDPHGFRGANVYFARNGIVNVSEAGWSSRFSTADVGAEDLNRFADGAARV